MENTNNTNTRVTGGKKKLYTASLIFCITALLCLGAYELYSVSVSQKAALALQGQMDELLRTLTGYSQLSAESQSSLAARDAEIKAMQARINELLQALAALNEKSQEEGDARDAEMGALQARMEALNRKVEKAAIAIIPNTNMPLASLPDTEAKDSSVPLAPMPALATDAPAAKAQAGQTITVAVYATEIKDMYGYELKVYFGSEIIKYSGGLESGIPAIPTIFSKEFEDYVLIGATMIGKKAGYTAEAGKTEVCVFSFTALQDCDLSELRIGSVNIVGSGMEYKENITDWEIAATVV